MNATTEIRKAYQVCRQQGTGHWVKISSIAERVDLTFEQIRQAIIELNQTDMDFHTMPESNQKTLSKLDVELAVYSGGDWNHLISWQ